MKTPHLNVTDAHTTSVYINETLTNVMTSELQTYHQNQSAGQPVTLQSESR
jgi:hypothetical protein